jgi:hypothetical protein
MCRLHCSELLLQLQAGRQWLQLLQALPASLQLLCCIRTGHTYCNSRISSSSNIVRLLHMLLR